MYRVACIFHYLIIKALLIKYALGMQTRVWGSKDWLRSMLLGSSKWSPIGKPFIVNRPQFNWTNMQWSQEKDRKIHQSNKPRTTDAQLSFFVSKSQTFGLEQTIWADKFWGIWGIFQVKLPALILVMWVPCPCLPLINHYFYKKQKQNPEYLFGIGIWIWIWVAKN